MKVLGIITEYNPLHNGHIYHLEKSLSVTSADATVCVMSGNFVQRGEPAIVDKWIRTEMALNAGIDMVIELPAVYALSSAELFAFGAAKILDSIGLVDFMCFGSENGELEPLNTIAGILASEPEEYKKFLKAGLDNGISYPAARETALNMYINNDISEYVTSSNNILGIEYLKALKRLESNIKPYTIQRVGGSYNSEHVSGNLSSATSIRNVLAKRGGSAEEISSTMPQFSYEILLREFSRGRGPVHPGFFGNTILSYLRGLSPGKIAETPDVSEGLENRIKYAAAETGTIKEFMRKVSTKRYATTRISRVVFNMLLGITDKDVKEFNLYGGPQYIRVLGFSSRGRELLSTASKSSLLPIIVKTSDYKHSCNRLLRRMLEIDTNATDQYVLAYGDNEAASGGQDFTRKAVFFDG